MKLASTMVNLDDFRKQKGSWGVQTRKRKGLHYSSDYYSGTTVGVGIDRYTDRILSDSDLWVVYKRCADVRAAIDSIVRRVATFDWIVIPKVSPQNPEYGELQKIANHVNNFFMRPNRNGDTWQEIMTAMLTDCLVFDSGVLELAYDRRGYLQELVPLRGCTISPVIDEYGRLQFYEQNIFEEGTYFSTPTNSTDGETFKAKQIMYLSLFKNTAVPSGNPIIESLVNQVIALMRASEHAMLNLDADEVPPGILVLAGIAGKAAEEAKADLQRLKGQDHKVRVMTTPDPTGVGAKWLELRRSPKDIQMHEVIQDIRRVIYRTFGVMPVEMGMTQGMPKATASVQMDVASSHLVTPILELLQAKINSQIIPAVVRSRDVSALIQFKFDRESRLSPQEQLHLSNSYRHYVTQGIMTRNEIRETLGLLPIVGGDVPTVEVAGMPQALEAIITGFQPAVAPSEDVKIEIDEVVEELEEEPPAPPFGDSPTKNPVLLESRKTNKLERSKFGVYGESDDPLLKEDTPDAYNINYPVVEPPDDDDTLKELDELIRLSKSRKQDKKFIKQADEDLVQCFIEHLQKINLKNYFPDKTDPLDFLETIMNEIVFDASIAILKLKYFFNRPRPFQVAERASVEFLPLNSKTAHTPSYPSGHAIQALLIAECLSNLMPQYKAEFFDIANKISYSRMVAGYHFRSDLDYGEKIFKAIISANRKED